MTFYWGISIVLWLLAFVYAQNSPRFIGNPIKEQIFNVMTASIIALLWPVAIVVVVVVVLYQKLKPK